MHAQQGGKDVVDLCSSSDDEQRSPRPLPAKRRLPPAPQPVPAPKLDRQPHPLERRLAAQKEQRGGSGSSSSAAPRLGLPGSSGSGGRGGSGAPGRSTGGGNNADWMFGGSGAYLPDPRTAKVDMTLRLHEIVDVLDLGLVKHHARALLDSGELLISHIHGRLTCCTFKHASASSSRAWLS
jgi:hypothetical protein